MVTHFFVLSALAAFWFCSWPATASLYPTKPISTTIYEAGTPCEVTWAEDGNRPLLNRTGTMKIDLYEGNNTYLATLTKDVNPIALSTIVFIPPSVIPRNYHSFTLRFITVQPRQIIYTADFNLIPNAFSQSSSSASSQSSPLATVTSTVVTQISQPSATQTESAGLCMSWVLGRRPVPGGQFAFDSDKMKFRLMFIVWPALVGLSMAL